MLKSLSPQTIAIIGGGFSGAMVAAHLLRQASHPLQIQLIDRRTTPGQGTAYSTPFDCHLLNVPVGKMSAFPDQPDHFFDWLQNRSSVAQGDQPNLQPGFQLNIQSNLQLSINGPVAKDVFVARKVYGAYIQAVLAEACQSAAEGVQLEYIQDVAEAIYPQSQGAWVYLQSGRVLAVNQVVLAFGNFPPADPPVADRTFYQSPRYIGNPWSRQAFTAIDRSQPLLLIGSGLTMLDWVTALQEQGFRHSIYVVSRRGRLPHSHQPTRPYELTLSKSEFPQTVRSGLRWLRQEVERAQQQGSDWRAVIDGLRPHTQALWQNLPLAEQKRFLRHVRPYWEVHRHRVAPKVAERMNSLLQSGQMQVQAGRVQAYQEFPQGVEVSIRLRHQLVCPQPDRVKLSVGTVVNCTGADCNYRKLQPPLIKNLLEHGLVFPDALGLGLETAANGALIQANHQPSTWLFTLGAVQKGRLWETTAVPELRHQAATLAQTLLKQAHQVSPSESYQISRSRSFRYSKAL